MYRLDGLLYRVFCVGGIILIVSVILSLLSKFWDKRRLNRSDLRIAIFGIVLSLIYCGAYVYKIINPDILAYQGYFEEAYRDSRVAPPIPATYAYVFSNNESKKAFYLDSFSKKNIIKQDFKKGDIYCVYYEKGSRIIVGIEYIDSK